MKRTQSEIDGVAYRRAKTWQIALVQMNSAASMCFYVLMNLASYMANGGYGILTTTVGVILMGTRILDGITDPIIALLIDKTNTKYGKIRIFMAGGWVIEAFATWLMFMALSDRGYGVFTFTLTYIVYVIGYTMNNVVHQIVGPVMTNDPKQRPLVGVWSTLYNYFVPTVLSIISVMVILPMYDNQYSVGMLRTTWMVDVGVSFVLVVLALIGVTASDKPENFAGINAKAEDNKVSVKDMWNLLKGNRALQCYIASVASDKLAQQVSGQVIITTMLYGILIGNVQLGTMISMIAMFPAIVFVIIGAKYAGKHGNKEATVTWTKVCIVIAAVTVVFFLVIDPKLIADSVVPMAVFFILSLALNGTKMCVTAANSGLMADVIDYELERSGKFIPAAITATYSFIDKVITSLSAVVATSAVALIGYKSTLPQPTDEATTPIFVMTMVLYYGLPLVGWGVTLLAMRFCPLSKDEMVRVQKEIAAKKAQAMNEVAKDNNVLVD